MENLDSQHGQHTDTILQAAREIDRIDLYETVLADYELVIAARDDTADRIHDLLNLTNYYYGEFGVHFEKRHAYRDQLIRVLTGDLDNLDGARTAARDQYSVTDGFGLPRLEQLARHGVVA